MSVLFNKGFFPFTIDNQDIPAPPDDRPFKNIQLPLSSLTRAFWLAKSFDYNIDVAFSGPYVFSPTGTITGNIIGSGTANIGDQSGNELISARRVINTNAGSIYSLPASPLMLSSPFDPWSRQLDWTYFDGVDSFSGTSPLLALWFAQFNSYLGQSIFKPSLVSKDASGNYWSRFQANIASFNGGPGFGTDFAPGLVVSGIDSNLMVDGFDVTLPFYTNPTATATGTVLFNFNSFYSD